MMKVVKLKKAHTQTDFALGGSFYDVWGKDD